jgi:hypothetical protein
MPSSRDSEAKGRSSRARPALSPEAREKQLTSLAYDLAEKQLREGTASSQVISTFLKYGSSRERLEQERLERENHFLRIKSEQIQSQQKIEDLYVKAMDAFRGYSGQDPEPDRDRDSHRAFDDDDGY